MAIYQMINVAYANKTCCTSLCCYCARCKYFKTL